jgi:hypothetical protein
MVDFNVVIDKFVADSKEKMLAVVKNSIQEVVQDAQTPIAKGGKMPVDTGFLRSSGTANLNNTPSGEILGRKRLPGEEGVLADYAVDDKASYLTDTLIKMKIGDTFFFGWTAIYAKRQEVYNGFMESAIMNWQNIVNNQVRRLHK